MNTEEHPVHPHPPFRSSRAAIALAVMGGVALFFLFEEHRAHLLGLLPYLILFACPLMHLFMHHGHHHGHRPPQDNDRTSGDRP
ncbi:DUF2933 family protein [Fluviicoccus keumensis]|uniref:DUF2933 family protein n=1 Tax=Fluviicoccus keumensis TaxID=1435465 RepID=A0A4Q7ZD88_9GAMM|nr:DUF2933 family protein [Fluviicoccus keumensis]